MTDARAVVSRPVAAHPHLGEAARALVLEKDDLAVRVERAFLARRPEGLQSRDLDGVLEAVGRAGEDPHRQARAGLQAARMMTAQQAAGARHGPHPRPT